MSGRRHFAVEVMAPGMAKVLYAGANPGKAEAVVRRMRRDCGWDARWPAPGSVGVVTASTAAEAQAKLWALQDKAGLV